MAKVSRSLDILENSVNSCSKTAIEDAAIAGKELGSMNTEEFNRFRSLTGRYKNDCLCTKAITREQVTKKGKEISEELQRFSKTATEKGRETYEELATKGRERYEEMKGKAAPKIAEIRGKAASKFSEMTIKAQEALREAQERAERYKTETT